jgi:hypothetical protein
VWVGGRWSAPAPGHHWVAGTWEKNGNRWTQRHGYWERDHHQ